MNHISKKVVYPGSSSSPFFAAYKVEGYKAYFMLSADNPVETVKDADWVDILESERILDLISESSDETIFDAILVLEKVLADHKGLKEIQESLKSLAVFSDLKDARSNSDLPDLVKLTDVGLLYKAVKAVAVANEMERKNKANEVRIASLELDLSEAKGELQILAARINYAHDKLSETGAMRPLIDEAKAILYPPPNVGDNIPNWDELAQPGDEDYGPDEEVASTSSSTEQNIAM